MIKKRGVCISGVYVFFHVYLHGHVLESVSVSNVIVKGTCCVYYAIEMNIHVYFQSIFHVYVHAFVNNKNRERIEKSKE